MPYVTRQTSINFPKKKSVLRTNTRTKLTSVVQSPESKPVRLTSVSSSARKAFHGTFSGNITGRQKELKQLREFFLSHAKNQTSGSIYISGLPGTGKTACINYIIEENQLSVKYQIIKINCTVFNSSKAVFDRLRKELKLKADQNTEKKSVTLIETYLLKKHKMILLILDEIDQLESKSQSVLYKIFEWPSWKNSKLVLVGIANAMDLTDRYLPRLCAKMELKPILLHFSPYTKDEIASILINRLTEAGVNDLFAPGAVELISAKVAGTSGDIRRALDLGKRVIEIAEQKNIGAKSCNQQTESISSSKNTVNKKLEESFCDKSPFKLEYWINNTVEQAKPSEIDNVSFSEISPQNLFKHNVSTARVCLGEITPQKINISSPGKILRKSPIKLSHSDIKSDSVKNTNGNYRKRESPVKKSPIKVAKEEVLRKSPRKLHFDVNSKDVLSVVKTVFGSIKKFKPSEESSFPLHQKLLICTVLLIMKKGKKKDLSVGKLHQVYSKICTKRSLSAVDKSGFLFLCRQVEMTGVIRIGKGPGMLAKVSLQWDENEIADSLKDLNMLSSILNDTTCLF